MKQEGSSQARYFVSRLIPAHKDPPYEQVNSPSSTLFLIVRLTCCLDRLYLYFGNDFFTSEGIVSFEWCNFCRRQDFHNWGRWHQNNEQSWKPVLFTSTILVSVNGCEVWKWCHHNQVDDGDHLKGLRRCMFQLVRYSLLSWWSQVCLHDLGNTMR